MPGEKGHTGSTGQMPCDEGSGVPKAKGARSWGEARVTASQDLQQGQSPADTPIPDGRPPGRESADVCPLERRACGALPSTAARRNQGVGEQPEETAALEAPTELYRRPAHTQFQTLLLTPNETPSKPSTISVDGQRPPQRRQ